MHEIQQKILQLAKYQDLSKLGYRRIGKLIGVSHPQVVKHHVSQLIKKGHIKFDKSNNLIATIKTKELVSPLFSDIPVYGSANCGIATLIAEDRIEGYIKVSDSLLKKKKVIALKAVGNSMNKANIYGLTIEEGDYVLVDTINRSPKNEDYVLSIIDDCANIKKYIKKSPDQIALLSESSEKFSPIYISSNDNYLIGGVVTQVIKNAEVKGV